MPRRGNIPKREVLMDPIYKAVAEVVEESILNALCAADTMVGRLGSTFFEMPQEQVIALLKMRGKL